MNGPQRETGPVLQQDRVGDTTVVACGAERAGEVHWLTQSAFAPYARLTPEFTTVPARLNTVQVSVWLAGMSVKLTLLPVNVTLGPPVGVKVVAACAPVADIDTTAAAAAVTWQFMFLSRRLHTFERTADQFASQTTREALHGQLLPELGARLAAFVDIRCHRWKNASLCDTAAMVCYALLRHGKENVDAKELAAVFA